MEENNEIAIVTPCYNENITCIKFLQKLEEDVSNLPYYFTVVVVDDASTDNTIELLTNFQFKSDNLILKIIELNFNVGHQKAIYQGLLFAQTHTAQRFIVLDSDGEDDTQAIKDMLTVKTVDIVHVSRRRRKESFGFRLFYFIYKLCFTLITNKTLDFGNYCLFNKKCLDIIIYNSFIHFAAFLSKQKLKRATLFFDRQKRLDGKSKMNFSGLVLHAFKSFVEYAENLLFLFLRLSFISFYSVLIFHFIYILFKNFYRQGYIWMGQYPFYRPIQYSSYFFGVFHNWHITS